MSQIYPLALQGMLSKQIDVMGNPVRITLLTAAYVFNPSHQFRSSLAGSIALSSPLANKSRTFGVFRADPITLPIVVGGNIITSIVGYIDTGSAATDILVWINDGFAAQTNGADVLIQWDTGPDGIFAVG